MRAKEYVTALIVAVVRYTCMSKSQGDETILRAECDLPASATVVCGFPLNTSSNLLIKT